MTGVSFHFDVPKELMLNVNQRDAHWGRRKAITSQLRAMGYKAGRECGVRLKHPVIQRVRFGWPTAAIRDDDNYMVTSKALTDGLVADAGLLPGDDNRYIHERHYSSAVTRSGHIEISISFEEVPA